MEKRMAAAKEGVQQSDADRWVAGIIHETDGRTPSVSVTRQALELDKSMSLVINQEPMATALRGHTGPSETQGLLSPVSSCRCSKGKALARTAGPMPRSHDRL